MTPLEETIQRLMEPDKHGEKGEPARCAAGADYFGHGVQRTLDALWKYAEGVAAASKDSMDWYNQAIARIEELEAFARNVATNYDHDEDAHIHGTPCRVCDAEAILKN